LKEKISRIKSCEKCGASMLKMFNACPYCGFCQKQKTKLAQTPKEEHEEKQDFTSKRRI
jgi:uncharacterized OB-fold protein